MNPLPLAAVLPLSVEHWGASVLAWTMHLGTAGKLALMGLAIAMVAGLSDRARHLRSFRQLEAMQQELLESRQQLLKANAQLSELSIRDGLTGLYNRRHFDMMLDRECRRAARARRNIALLMIDVDCFKQLNDRYGHQYGDDCLREVARVLQEYPKRGHDVVARYGGEEFVLLLPDATLSAAKRIAEGLRAAVAALEIPNADNTTGPFVTVSLGVCARMPLIGESPEGILRDADTALYVAKQLGRNRVELAEAIRVDAVEQGNG